MNQKMIIVAIAVFVLAIVGMFTFAYLHKNDDIPADTTATATTTDTATDAYSTITRVDAKHFYIDGVHTLVGEIDMPTPCDLLESSAIVAESFPEQIGVNFTVVNTADTCAQVVTPQRFKVSATASQDATFSATFMGRPIELNLVPAAAGETPDDFELFQKG